MGKMGNVFFLTLRCAKPLCKALRCAKPFVAQSPRQPPCPFGTFPLRRGKPGETVITPLSRTNPPTYRSTPLSGGTVVGGGETVVGRGVKKSFKKLDFFKKMIIIRRRVGGLLPHSFGLLPPQYCGVAMTGG